MHELAGLVACFVAPIVAGNIVLIVGWHRRRAAARHTT